MFGRFGFVKVDFAVCRADGEGFDIMSKESLILVVDDERDHAEGVAEALEKVKAKTLVVYNAKDALQILSDESVDVVVTDLKLEDEMGGLDILRSAKRQSEQTEVILITAYASIETCKKALKEGAYDYLVKPIDIDQLRALVQRAVKRTARSQAFQRSSRNHKEFSFDGVRGQNPQMLGIFEVLRRVAPTDIPVLIQGPSGTGKELLAKAIHQNSHRWNKAFRPINCAGLAESLLESELFGHTKGAFTGATQVRKGLFEIADNGTLFLDEIGDMPLAMQAKLLRVIEDGVVVAVGSSKRVVVDVRIISATNHNLPRMIEEGRFRQDLYFRIKGVSVTVPSLQERSEDIGLFVDSFLKEASRETGYMVSGITDPAVNALRKYNWPGNIRQLRNTIRSMVVMCETEKLDVADIPAEIHQVRQLTGTPGGARNLGGVALNDLEKQAIVETLARTGNNREKAAKILGIGERTLYRKIKEYKL